MLCARQLGAMACLSRSAALANVERRSDWLRRSRRLGPRALRLGCDGCRKLPRNVSWPLPAATAASTVTAAVTVTVKISGRRVGGDQEPQWPALQPWSPGSRGNHDAIKVHQPGPSH